MTTPEPSFMKSKYFVMEFNNWHMKEGAPQKEVDELNAYLALLESKKK